MTVHKAQGSEFDEVLVLLPAQQCALVANLLQTSELGQHCHKEQKGFSYCFHFISDYAINFK